MSRVTCIERTSNTKCSEIRPRRNKVLKSMAGLAKGERNCMICFVAGERSQNEKEIVEEKELVDEGKR